MWESVRCVCWKCVNTGISHQEFLSTPLWGVSERKSSRMCLCVSERKNKHKRIHTNQYYLLYKWEKAISSKDEIFHPGDLYVCMLSAVCYKHQNNSVFQQLAQRHRQYCLLYVLYMMNRAALSLSIFILGCQTAAAHAGDITSFLLTHSMRLCVSHPLLYELKGAIPYQCV